MLRTKLDKSKPGDVITLQKCPLAINVLIDDPNIVANAAVDWSRLSLDKNSVFVPIPCYNDNKLRAKASTTKPVPLDAPSLI